MEEQRVLRLSIVATVVLAALGISFGLYAGSQSIVFDGLFNAIDSSMAMLSLVVSRLLVKQPGQRFQQGYWHIEPMALALNGSVLIMLCLYALLNSVADVLQGGRELEFGSALFYALFTALGSGLMYAYLLRCNQRLQSALVQMDLHSWLMSTAISLALLVAFAIGYLMQGSAYEGLSAYIDPLILGLLTLLLAPLPCRTVAKSVRQILRITPAELDGEITSLMARVSQRYGLERFTHCVMQSGRGLFVEIHILLPAAMNHWTVSELDQVRAEIAQGIGREGPNRWLAIGFTRDGRWL